MRKIHFVQTVNTFPSWGLSLIPKGIGRKAEVSKPKIYSHCQLLFN